MATAEKTNRKHNDRRQATWFSHHAHTLIIAAFTFLLYANMLGNGYNLDDELVTRNHRLTSQGISAIPEIFASPYYQDNMGYAYEYRPIVLSTFAIEHAIFGEKPFVSHLISLLLYIALCIALYKFLLLVGGGISPFLAFMITLFFSAFTPHTEVVCSIKNRDEILGFLFSIMAMQYVLIAEMKKKHFLYGAAVLFYVLALLNKITFLGLMPVILFVQVFFSRAQFTNVILCSAALAIPSFLLIGIGNLYDKLLITLAVLVTGPVFYAIRELLFIDMKAELSRLWGKLVIQVRTALEWLSTEVKIGSINLSLKEGLGLQTFRPSFRDVVVSLLLAGVYVHSYLYFQKAEAIIALIGLWSLVVFAGQGIAWWAYLFFAAIVGAYTSENFTPDIITTSLVHCVGALLLYGFYIGPKQRKLPTLLLAALFGANHLWKIIELENQAATGFAAAVIELFLVYLSYLVIPRVYLTYSVKLGKIMSVGVVVVTVLINLVIGKVELNILAFVATSIFIFWWVNKSVRPRLVMPLIGVLIVGLVVALQNDPQNSERKTPVIEVVNTISDVSKTTKTTVLPDNQDRPISYIETPTLHAISWSEKAGTSLVVMLHYLKKTIVPYPLAFYYGFAFIVPHTISSPTALISLVLLCGVFLVAFYFLKANWIISLGLLLYLTTVLMYSNLFLPVPGIVADRYLLVSSLGWCIVLGYGLFYLLQKFVANRKIESWKDLPLSARLILLLPLLMYSVLTFSRNLDWKDHLTLMRKDVQYVTNSAQAHNLLGLNIMKYATSSPLSSAEQVGLFQEAVVHFKKSHEIYPKTFNVVYDIGRVYAGLNEADSAIVYFEKASELDTLFPDLYLNLGDIHLAKGNLTQAIPCYAKYTDLVPNIYDGFSKLSYVYFQLKQYEQSISTNRRAMATLPNNLDPYINIGQTYTAMGRRDSARLWLLKADSLSGGNNPNVKNLLQSLVE